MKSNKTGVIIGLDEAGWGAYGGPFTIGCAVYLRDFAGHCKIKDSKRFSSHNALRLGVEAVKKTALYYSAAVQFHAKTFDELQESRDYYMTELATAAAAKVRESIQHADIEVIVDGETIPDGLELLEVSLLLPFSNVTAVPRADSLYPAVSAASILAKYTRDDYMIKIAKNYPPEFKLESNKGYGTKEHHEALKQHGALDIHYPYIHGVKAAIKDKGYWNG